VPYFPRSLDARAGMCNTPRYINIKEANTFSRGLRSRSFPKSI